jgi:hypothetical protein
LRPLPRRGATRADHFRADRIPAGGLSWAT